MMLTVQRLPLLLLLSAAASSRAVVSSDESTASTHQSLPHLEGEVGDGVGRGAAREGGGGGVFGLAPTRHRSLQEGERPPKGSWKKKAVTPPEPKAGVPWTADDRSAWADTRVPEQRSYADDVLTPMHMLRERLRGVMIVGQYGELAVDPNKYPLYFARSLHWRSERPSVLITGGVHGYETSGVQGALLFLTGGHAAAYAAKGVNILVAPCVSPWGYEHIQRWNPEAVDPNRSFLSRDDAAACGSQEAANLVRLLQSCDLGPGGAWAAHVDLHETTDTDETEFRVAKAARDGEESEPGTIPDGFYLCGDEKNPQIAFQRAVIAGVRKVTHIAPPDPDNTIIGSPVVDEGVILYDCKIERLCKYKYYGVMIKMLKTHLSKN